MQEATLWFHGSIRDSGSTLFCVGNSADAVYFIIKQGPSPVRLVLVGLIFRQDKKSAILRWGENHVTIQRWGRRRFTQRAYDFHICDLHDGDPQLRSRPKSI